MGKSGKRTIVDFGRKILGDYAKAESEVIERLHKDIGQLREQQFRNEYEGRLIKKMEKEKEIARQYIPIVPQAPILKDADFQKALMEQSKRNSAFQFPFRNPKPWKEAHRDSYLTIDNEWWITKGEGRLWHDCEPENEKSSINAITRLNEMYFPDTVICTKCSKPVPDNVKCIGGLMGL